MIRVIVLMVLMLCGCSGVEVMDRYYAIAGGEPIVVMEGVEVFLLEGDYSYLEVKVRY